MVCSVARARRHQGSVSCSSSGHQSAPNGAQQGALAWSPQDPPPLLPPCQVHRPRCPSSLTRRLSSCCLTQRDASGLNVTSRPRRRSGSRRAGERERAWQEPRFRGGGRPGTGSPPSSHPGGGASAAVRTDERSEKQPLRPAGRRSKQRLPPPFPRQIHLQSARLPRPVGTRGSGRVEGGGQSWFSRCGG